MQDFSRWMEGHQMCWRRRRVSTFGRGMWHGRKYAWILPATSWEEGLFPDLRTGSIGAIVDYVVKEKIQMHTGANNLKSSWIACVNLYFPFRQTEDGRSLLTGFLRSAVTSDIRSLDRVELEYAEAGDLSATSLLGEAGGNRGSGQTSPDIAFLVNGETGIVLTESKLTEGSFSDCSARTLKTKRNRPGNPKPGRCLDAEAIATQPESMCHQVVWGRKYWERLAGSVSETALRRLTACPAARGGYQLFRQQALAEGYTRKYSLVFSAVAYDARNEALINSLKRTGIHDFPAGWGALFKGRAGFAAWTHQAWVDWVRRHQTGGWDAWLEWISARYDYSSAEAEQSDAPDKDTRG